MMKPVTGAMPEGCRIFSLSAGARGLRLLALGSAAALGGGCSGEHIQSALHPASPAAAEIAWIWWFMCITASVVFVAVIGLLIVALFRRHAERPSPPLGSIGFVVAGGLVVPAIILVVLLVFSLQTTLAIRAPEETALTVEVVGHQWWWEVHYPERQITTANEIHIPTGQPVRLELRAADVIHSFWVPALHGKMDMMPEHTTTFWIQADKPGLYRGQCAEFCGVQHAWMAFFVVALPPDDFRAWVAAQQQPAPQPATGAVQRGQEVFMEAGCANCHAIRGTQATGRVGPDLTHMGSRLSIGAGVVDNTRGNLGGWIVDPQRIKPGNRMPPTYLEPVDLHALLDYMEHLR